MGSGSVGVKPLDPPKGLKTCGRCRFIGSDVLFDREQVHVCRRNPPVPINVNRMVLAAFPGVKPDEDWCGEFVWEERLR